MSSSQQHLCQKKLVLEILLEFEPDLLFLAGKQHLNNPTPSNDFNELFEYRCCIL